MIDIWELNIGDGLNFVMVDRQSFQEFDLILNVNVLQTIEIDDVRVGNNHHPLFIDCEPIEIVLRGVRYNLVKQDHTHFVVYIQDDDRPFRPDKDDLRVREISNYLLWSKIVHVQVLERSRTDLEIRFAMFLFCANWQGVNVDGFDGASEHV